MNFDRSCSNQPLLPFQCCRTHTWPLYGCGMILPRPTAIKQQNEPNSAYAARKIPNDHCSDGAVKSTSDQPSDDQTQCRVDSGDNRCCDARDMAKVSKSNGIEVPECETEAEEADAIVDHPKAQAGLEIDKLKVYAEN